ncbi:uncharacterized protein Dana_GF27522 [Drosophila ananassae]|uniref:Reverse transcriptase zinc-binding domain-containing protein n=1 Tax=Drosophila ananassae TaxID=7217 RepID=A0A0P8ZSQ0_DROAN|nr:uncharacterized protein Dana_GF27522 [Drosophila ananassae]
MLDTRLSFREHLEYAHKRASETIRALSRKLLNIRGPRQEWRKLNTSVVSSQILYAAPVWAEAMTVRSYVWGIEADYRLCALRTSCAFRTVSDNAALVIAGLIPLGELVREKSELGETAQDETASASARKAAARARSLANWQSLWENSTKGLWTHRLIPDKGIWTGRKHGEVDFYLTQALSGHGCFRSYLKRFGHEREDGCPSCGRGVMKDAYHVLFDCWRFDEERTNLEESLEETFLPVSRCH